MMENFFRSFRVVLTNAFSYPKDHPYFIKSVEKFKLQLDLTLEACRSLKIGVTDNGVMVDGKVWSKNELYSELSRILHQRKIKSIEIKAGITTAELVSFLSLLSLPIKEILKNGGINAILAQEPLAHLALEELDYSVFLQAQGQECTDLWAYMLKDAARKNDGAKLFELADTFGSLIKQVNEKDLFTGTDVSGNINDFLISLKNKDKEKFDKCMKDVFLWLLRNKKFVNAVKLEKFDPVFKGLNQDDFSALFWDGLLQEDNFDALSLQLFSKISGQDSSVMIPDNFMQKINKRQNLNDNPGVAKKILNLLSSNQENSLSAVYRSTLESLVKDISFSGNLVFDAKLLRDNYYYIILTLLSTDLDKDSLGLVITVLESQLPGIFQDNALDFLKDLWRALTIRKKERLEVLLNFEKKFAMVVENRVLNAELSSEQEFLLDLIIAPSQNINFYLDKIFSAKKVDKQILNLYLRLFANELGIFYERIEAKLQDLEFLFSLVNALSQLEVFRVAVILEYIYTSANELVKIEVLKALKKMRKVNVAFLMRQLDTASVTLKKELVSVIVLDPQGKEKVIGLLLGLPSPWGNKNKIIIDNLQIIYALDLKESASQIKKISARRFFWNKQLRFAAKKILKEWDVN